VADAHADRVGRTDGKIALEGGTRIADAFFPVDLGQNPNQVFDSESLRALKLHPNLITFHLQ